MATFTLKLHRNIGCRAEQLVFIGEFDTHLGELTLQSFVAAVVTITLLRDRNGKFMNKEK